MVNLPRVPDLQLIDVVFLYGRRRIGGAASCRTDPEWGVTSFNQRCQTTVRFRLAQNTPPGYRGLAGDRGSYDRTTHRESSELQSVLYESEWQIYGPWCPPKKCNSEQHTLSSDASGNSIISIWSLGNDDVCFCVYSPFQARYLARMRHSVSRVFRHFCERFPLQQLVVNTRSGFRAFWFSEGARFAKLPKIKVPIFLRGRDISSFWTNLWKNGKTFLPRRNFKARPVQIWRLSETAKVNIYLLRFVERAGEMLRRELWF